MHTTDLSLRNLNALVLVATIPSLLLGLVVAGLGVGALSTIDGRTWALAHELHAGTLEPSALTEWAGWMRHFVLGMLVLVGVSLPTSVATAWMSLKRLSQRIDSATKVLSKRAAGEPAEAFPVATACALGRLETAITAVSASLDDRDRAFDREVRGNRFEGELQRALELVDDESDVMDVAVRALGQAMPDRAVELLLADSSQAHLRRATATPEMGGTGCSVGSPNNCAAVRRGRTLRFGSSESLDACPRLRGRGVGACSAVCSPVTVMGRTIGVLHLQGEAGAPVPEDDIRHFRSIATNVGTRLGVIRTLADTQRAARTDPLTGMMNRRTFETEAAKRMAASDGGLLVMADMDHFKRLNDTHGHQAGDRALCLFARVLKDSLRSDDLAARYGGEEFILLVPGVGLSEGVAILERAREALADALRGSSVPPFTCSMGVSQYPVDGVEVSELTEVADAALYQAKRNGRNRVEVAGHSAKSTVDLAAK